MTTTRSRSHHEIRLFSSLQQAMILQQSAGAGRSRRSGCGSKSSSSSRGRPIITFVLPQGALCLEPATLHLPPPAHSQGSRSSVLHFHQRRWLSLVSRRQIHYEAAGGGSGLWTLGGVRHCGRRRGRRWRRKERRGDFLQLPLSPFHFPSKQHIISSRQEGEGGGPGRVYGYLGAHLNVNEA